MVYRLIILLGAHSRNLRRNIEHREILLALLPLFYGGLLFFACARFFIVYAHRGVRRSVKNVLHHFVFTLFPPPPRDVLFLCCFFITESVATVVTFSL